MFRAMRAAAAALGCYTSSCILACDTKEDKDQAPLNFEIKDMPKDPKKVRLPYNQDTTPKWEYNFYGHNKFELSDFDRKKIYSVAKNRDYHVKMLSDPENIYDIIVIGGGSAGASVALDAASRGLHCAVLERNDFGSGTSSRSTKLIHGGMRYLEQAMKLESGFFEKLGLVVEGLRERNYMVNSLPYLNTEVKLVVPLFSPWQMVYYGCGVYIYHFISYIHWLRSSYKIKFTRPQWYGKSEMKELFPNLKPCRGVMFAEGQMIDSRTLIQTLLTTTIESYNGGFAPANIANYMEVKSIIKKDGKAIGVEVLDKVTNKTFKIYAKAIINCAGPYSDEIRRLDNPNAPQRIVGSNGVHIILPSAPYTPKDVGIFIPKTEDGRVMFVIPYQGKTLSGTTDHNCKIDPSPTVPENDIKEITKELDHYFIGTQPEKNILASWNGIRPLVIDKKYEGKQIDTSDTKLFTRLHVVDFSESGVASLMGGKWTSYRQMGYDAVQEVIDRNPKLSPVFNSPVTTSLKLYGSYTSQMNKKDFSNPRAFIPVYEKFLQKQYSIPADVARHLVYYYGTKSVHIAELGKQINGMEKIVPNEPYIQAEVAYVLRHEMAVNLKDVVFRRLGIGFLNTELTKGEFTNKVADLMQKELKWSDKEKEAQIKELLSSLNSLN